MANSNDETIQLIIDAENLSADELNAASKDVERLGVKVSETEKELKRLEINKAQIATFTKMKQETDEMSAALRKQVIENEDLVKSTKKLATAYDKQAAELNKLESVTEAQNAALAEQKRRLDEQRNAVLKSKEALADQRKVVASQKTEYKKLGTEVKKFGLHTRNAEKVQADLTAEIDKAQVKLKGQTSTLKQYVSAQEKAAVAHKKAADESEKFTGKVAKLNVKLAQYEAALSKLNAEKSKGAITTGQYIKGEEKLRRELGLTEKQASTTRRALEADSKAVGKKSKSTDLLTTATRRLAHAYTVLLAAQKATEAVGSSVKGYGELESAITKVEKTTGIARDQVVAMSDELKTLSQEVTPSATNELLRYAEVAGQMGVSSSEDILKIVAAADALAVSTDLAGDEAVLLSARILGMTGEGVGEIHNFSSALVQMGNSAKASESEIAHMTKEIVTGTTSLDLSSSAAIGFGTALKEMGQPAERSRSAMQDLSNTILDLANEGGESLEQLSNITGIAGDQIQESLGKEPEKVIIRFIEGLQGAKEAGITLKTSLSSVGITSKETNAVVGALAGNTERLSELVTKANDAYVSGNEHLREATKAYTDQDAILLRLANRFTDLKTKIGEAYAPDVIEGVDFLTQAMDENEAAIISMMEMLPELARGWHEVIESYDQFLAAFGGTGTLLEALGAGIKVTFNQITLAIRAAGLGFVEFRRLIAEATGASQEELDKLKAKSTEIKESMTQDLKDIENAQLRFAGQSSIAFEKFNETISENAAAISDLSEEQQKEINKLTELNELVGESTAYNEGNEESYRELSAAVLRAAKAREIETAQAEHAARVAAESAQKQTEAVDRTTVSLKLYLQSLLTADEMLKDGIITKEQHVTVTDKYNAAIARLSSGLDDSNRATENSVNANARLSNSLSESAENASKYSSKTIEMIESSRKLKLEIRELENQLKDLNEASDERTAIENELNGKLKEQTLLTAQLNTQKELETKTSFQLLEVQRQHNIELELLEARWKAGALTAAEYAKAKEDAAFKTETLNNLLGDSTQSLYGEADAANESATAIRNRNDAGSESTEQLQQQNNELQVNAGRAGASNALAERWLALQKQLQEQYDYTSLSTAELADELDRLNAEYGHNQIAMARATHDLIGVMKPIDDMTNAVNRHKVETIQQTQALNQLVTSVKNGTSDMGRLGDVTQYTIERFDKLGDSQLDPLRAAIQAARQEFKQLADEIDGTIDSTRDRLDELLGNESAILARRFEREREEMEELLDRAKRSGDSSLVGDVTQAIANLGQIETIERKELNQQQGSSSATSFGDTSTSSSSSSAAQTQEYNVNINLPSGSVATVGVASSDDADRLINILSQLGETNINGVT